MSWWKKREPAAPPQPPAHPSPAPAARADVSQVWAAGFQHHQAGRLAQAAQAYREVLAALPDHFGARHLLGVVALQEGRHDEAFQHISEAIRIDPREASAHSNLGTVLLRSGQLAQARAALETAVSLDPRDADAAANLATVLMRLGDAPAAAQALRAALAAGAAAELRNDLGVALLDSDAAAAASEFRALLRERPDHADAQANLGVALERCGDFEGALREYERAQRIDLRSPRPPSSRAALLARLGRMDEARVGFEEAVRRAPDSAGAHANLGALLRDTGHLPLAAAALERALQLDPKLPEARLNAAAVALDTGEPARAEKLLAPLLQAQPRHAEALAMRGRIDLAQGRLAEAEAALRRALESDPLLAPAHHVLGLVSMALGDAQAAAGHHERASQLDPADARARWAAVMARLEPLPSSEAAAAASREAFAQGVAELDRWFDPARAAHGYAAVGSTQPFYLAYQAGNHKALLAPYGRLCARLMAAWPGRPSPAPAHAAGRPIRLGIVSAQVRDHSVWTAILRGWVQHIDRSRFEVHLFSLGGVEDPQTRAARALVPHFHAGPAGFQEWTARIAAAACDVLLYPEVGMDAMTTKLASLRLAPLQLATWGHPLTTGLPTLDAFISAAAFEPPGAQDHYGETLVALPGIGVHYEPLQVEPRAVDRRALGLPPGAPLLLCPGLPYKYAAADDDLWVDIARRLPQARLVFFRAGPPRAHLRLRERLSARFSAHGLDAQAHLAWLPQLPRPEFFALMREATLFLDSVGFSGFNTVMQAIECALPVIALEGDAMRGRFGSGVLRQAGLDDCVAATRTAYADSAVALVLDEARRAEVQARLRAARERLFSTVAPVRALEDFIERRARAVD